MADKPIIFSGPMVRALLEWRKTQTRRLIKWQGPRGFPHSFDHARIDNPAGVPRLLVPYLHPEEPQGWDDCPMHRHYGPADPGDRLYVREAIDKVSEPGAVFYRADYEAKHGDASGLGWRPSIHMPRWASRLTLTVTDVRVQRLRDISNEDAVAEGCSDGVFPWEEFRDLWNSLHGPDAWVRNSWVVALTFTVQHGNIDQIGRTA